MLWRLKHGFYSKSTHNLIKKMTALPGVCRRIMRLTSTTVNGVVERFGNSGLEKTYKT